MRMKHTHISKTSPTFHKEVDTSMVHHGDGASAGDDLLDNPHDCDISLDVPVNHMVQDVMDVPHVSDFASCSMSSYQNNCIMFSPLQAAKDIVLQSSNQDTRTDILGEIQVDVASVRHFLQIATLVSVLGENHRALLAKVLSSYDVCKYSRISLPSTEQDFKKHILNVTNKNSLFSLLPVPSYRISTGTELTTCSIRELVSFAMMFPSNPNFGGLHPRFFSIVESITFLEHLPNLSVPAPGGVQVVAYAIMWSDGWDPNTKSKGNRASVWTGTAGFLLVDVTRDPFPYDIVPSLWSVGAGKDGHNSAFTELLEEVTVHTLTDDGIRRPFKVWSRFHGCLVFAYICVGPFLQDQIERRAAAHLLAGNSNMHALFGTSCCFKKLAKPFGACRKCNAFLDKYIDNANWSAPAITSCKHCHGWDIGKLWSEGSYVTAITNLEHFQHTDHGYHHVTGPKEITFQDTSLAFEFAFKRYVSEGLWNRTDVTTYLELFCIAPATISSFLLQSQNHMAGLEARKENSEAFGSEDERLAVLRDSKDNPHMYHAPKVPSIWKLTTLRQLPESVMHLAMNLQKAVLRLIIAFAVSKKMGTSFIERCQPVLQMIQNLRVASAPVRTFKNERFGGFVAENYRAVSMILPWLSNILTEDGYDKTPVLVDYSAMKDKPVNKWTVKCMQHWLDERGIEYGSRWLKADLEAEVKTYHGKTSLPIIEQLNSSTCTVKEVRDLVHRSHKLFALLFATDETKVLGYNRYSAVARRFMSAIDDVHYRLYPNRTTPIWITKYNTVGVLRAAEMFLDHNLPRNMHEGGELGEAIVKKLRVLCPQAVKDGWSHNLINKFYRMRAMDGIATDVDECDTKFGMDPHVLGKFKRYKSEYDVTTTLGEGGVLSGLAYWDRIEKKTRVGVVINNQRWYFMEIHLENNAAHADEYGFTYFCVGGTDGRIQYEKNLTSLDIREELIFRKYVLFLPYLWAHGGMDSYYYAVVSEDWEYLNKNGWVNV
jgi:hypothetical protein